MGRAHRLVGTSVVFSAGNPSLHAVLDANLVSPLKGQSLNIFRNDPFKYFLSEASINECHADVSG